MGIIKAAINSIGGSFADQWLEYIKAGSLDSQTVMSAGVKVRGRDKRNENKEGSADFVSDGSLIEVGVNQFMILTDGGKIVDYTSEPGYYKVDNKNAPSMFNGGFSEAIEETFNRLRFGGVPSSSQKVYFINLQEIKDIAFGTPNPINYFDNFYNAELYLRTNGYFSIRITDPIKFYAEAIPKNMDHVSIVDIQKLYIAEFLTAFQTAVNKMSMDGIRISHVWPASTTKKPQRRGWSRLPCNLASCTTKTARTTKPLKYSGNPRKTAIRHQWDGWPLVMKMGMERKETGKWRNSG